MRDRKSFFPSKNIINLFLALTLLLSATACAKPRQVNANERLFLNLSLEYLDRYEIPKTSFKNTLIGGLSAITYDRSTDRFYILSDDRSQRAPARFYTVDINFKSTAESGKIAIDNVAFEDVTFLRDEQGNTYNLGTIDPEGIALSPRGTVFISSEGNPTKNVEPFIGEFDLKTGKKKLNLTIPQSYLSDDPSNPTKGIQENLAFESLTLNQNSLLPDDPFRLFTATESSLTQDTVEDLAVQPRLRFLHYVINPFGKPIVVAEHLYLLESAPPEVISNGLTELSALDREGYFLSLERTYGFTGAGAKIFQVVVANATDTSKIESLKGELTQVQPLKKQQLFDLQELGIYLDNIEGMTLGPRLPDGSQSLILISDDNFNEEQVTQVFLLRLSSSVSSNN
ncbi:MAG: esterase-like activity of phytase family protein [Pleurocapsa sp.]